MNSSIQEVGYFERKIIDSTTCEEGILRKEWRIRSIDDKTPGEPELGYGNVRDILGSACKIGLFVLEVRYIRFGDVVKPWSIMDSSDDLDYLLLGTDSSIVAVHPRLIELQAKIAEDMEKRRIEKEKEAEEEAKREEYLRLQKIRAAAMDRFKENPKNLVLLEKWQNYVDRVVANKELHSQLMDQQDFKESAKKVYESTTIPAIRKAMKDHLVRWEGVV